MSLSVFDYRSYRSYLGERLSTRGPNRGQRSRLADLLGVQGAFVSQVIGEKQNLSFEQAIRVAEFLGFAEEETDYFLLLVSFERAGSQKLRDHFRRKVDRVQQSRKEIKSRVRSQNTVSEQDQLLYFSSWIHAALHALITIPSFQEPRQMARRLGIPLKAVQESLDFLERIGIARQEQGRFQAGQARFHIDRDHPLLGRHHLNWRERSMIPLSNEDRSGQHYTCVMSASPADVERIRKRWLDFLDAIEPLIARSPEEELYVIQWDLFRA